MHPIAALNLVSILANLIAFVFLFKIRGLKRDVKLVIAAFFHFYAMLPQLVCAL